MRVPCETELLMLHEEYKKLEAENARLKTENERLRGVIDRLRVICADYPICADCDDCPIGVVYECGPPGDQLPTTGKE